MHSRLFLGGMAAAGALGAPAAMAPVLARFGANPTQGRGVGDGDTITGAEVSAGLAFGAGRLDERRGQRFAAAAVLMAEHEPEPPFPGGSLRTARPKIARFVQTGWRQIVADASARPGLAA